MAEHSADERPTVELAGSGLDVSGGEPSEQIGIESEVALARVRSRLRGSTETPVTVGRYRIVERLGRGGMGVVYAARDDELERIVAIKILHADMARSEDGRRRMLREAQAMAKLSHPNVGHVYEVGRHGEQVFLAMELVRGVTLRQWCNAPERTWRDILRVHVAAGEGLAAAHAVGLVHRDYKCENVLVGDDGRPRVLDFGLARPDALHSGPTEATDGGERASASGSAEITRAGTVVGTPAYMAPEQLAGDIVDARADQFSFCVALFECLYGQRPFAGSTVSQLAEQIRRRPPLAVDVRTAGVPRAVHAAILRGLRAAPHERHASMEHLLAVLRPHLSERARSLRLGSVAAALAVGAAAIAAGLQLRDRPSVPAPMLADPIVVAPVVDDWTRIVADSDLPPVVETPLVGDPTGMTVHRLPNGLTVYVATRTGEPFIEAHIALRAASVDEVPGQEGIASLTLWAIEAGSERLGTRDFARERPHLERQHQLLSELAEESSESARAEIMRRIAAAQQAAYDVVSADELHVLADRLGVRDERTFFDESVIAAAVPRNRFDTWLTAWAEVLRRPVFRNFASVTADKLELDRHYGENDIARALASRELPRASGHEDPVLAAENMLRLPLAEVRRFHETYYRPNNTAIVLVGDITAAEALPVVEAAFGDWEPAPVPRPEIVEPPLSGRKLVEIEDGGTPLVHLVWPLPPPSSPERAAYDDLAAALQGPDGLLARLFADRGLRIEPTVEALPRIFAITTPPMGAPLPDTEAALFDALRTIAEDRVPDDAWSRALARQELEASRWASSPDELAYIVSSSFTERVAWPDVAAHLARPAASRTALVATARELLARGVLVVHQSTGAPSVLSVDPLPFTALPRTTGLGAWARELLASPVTPLEPQFLVEGRHFEETDHGAGRVITARDGGPLYRLHWVFPVGTEQDPWACDAVRAQVHAHRHDEGLQGLDVDTLCTPTETSIEILGVTSRFDDAWPGLTALVQSEAPAPAAVDAYVDETLELRAQVRTHAIARTEALHSRALLGEHGVDARMPDDDTLHRRGAVAIPRAWTSLQRHDPDVLYVGPHPEQLRELLPPAGGRPAPKVGVPPLRRVDATTIFLLDDPGRETAEVRIALVPRGSTVRERLLDELFDSHPGGVPTPDDATWHGAGISPLDPEIARGRMVHLRGFRCSNRDLPRVVAGGLRMLRVVPTAASFEAARARLEAGHRAVRIPVAHVPGFVRSWSGNVDPRLEPWLGLGSIELDELAAHARTLAATPAIVSVIADADAVELDTLALYGRIVRVSIDDLLRDPELDDELLFAFPHE